METPIETETDDSNLLVILTMENHCFHWVKDLVTESYSWFSSKTLNKMKVCFKLKNEEISQDIKVSLIFNNLIISTLGIILGTDPFSIGVDLFYRVKDRYEHIFHQPMNKKQKDLASLLPQREIRDSLKWVKDILISNWGHYSIFVNNILAAIQSAYFADRSETMFIWSWWGLEWFFSKVGRDQILDYPLSNINKENYNVRKYLKKTIRKTVVDFEKKYSHHIDIHPYLKHDLEDVKERINNLILYPKLSVNVESAEEILTELEEFRQKYFKEFSNLSQSVLNDLGEFTHDQCKELVSNQYRSYRTDITHHGLFKASEEKPTSFQILEYSTRVTVLFLLITTAFSPTKIDPEVIDYNTRGMSYEEIEELKNQYSLEFFKEARSYEVEFEQKNIKTGEILRKNITLSYQTWENNLLVLNAEDPKEGHLMHPMIYSDEKGSSRVQTRITLHPKNMKMIITDSSNQKHNADVFLRTTSGFYPVFVKFQILRIQNENCESLIFS